MTLNFQFKKDWSSGQVSFKDKQYASGEIIESTTQPPYTVSNPRYTVEFKMPAGTVRVPFCFNGEAIIEPSAAPWLCNIGEIPLDPTPPPGSATSPVDDYKGSVQSIGAKIFSLRNIIIALSVIVLIGLYFKYVKK